MKQRKDKDGRFHREYLGSAPYVNLDGKSEMDYLTEEEQREEATVQKLKKESGD